MSEARKRLIIRVAIVTVAVALIALALITFPTGQAESEPDDPSASSIAGADQDNAAGTADQQNDATAGETESGQDPDPYGLAQLASWQTETTGNQAPVNASQQMSDANGAAVVRGNDSGQYSLSDQSPTPAVPGSFAGQPATNGAPPASQSPFGSPAAGSSGSNELRQPTPAANSYGGSSYADVAGAAAAGATAGAVTGSLSDTNSAGGQTTIPDAGSGYRNTTGNSPTPAYDNSSAGQQFGGTPQTFSMPSQSSPVPTPAAQPLPNNSSRFGTSTSQETPLSGNSSLRGNSSLGGTSTLGNTSPRSPMSPRSVFSSSASVHTSATPGPTQLDGVQSPSLVLEKRAPPEVQVGKTATFEVRVQNVGQVDAHDVVVTDQIPQGTQFESANPQPERAANGSLSWNLGTIEPGNSKLVSMQLIPQTEGEIGSVASVSFQTQASVRTRCTKPELTLEHSGPAKVLIGQNVSFDITVTNTGTGVATGVVLEEDVPEQLSHPAGGELEFEIGTLRPGESRQLKLTLRAANAGAFEHELLARGDGNLIAPDRVPVEVIAPRLNLELTGPSKKYLERQANYSLTVTNPGTAPATNVELVSYLPKGLKFISTNNHGQYDPQSHAVYWSLAQLPAQESGAVELALMAQEMGEQKLRVESRADLGLAEEQEKTVVVDGLAALVFAVADSLDPIEVGNETAYQIQVTNQGSKTATDVHVRALVPAGMQPVGGDGPTTYHISGQQLQFQPLARLAPKEQVVFNVKVRGIQPGDHRIDVQVSTREIPNPVSKEESTRVYLDQ